MHHSVVHRCRDVKNKLAWQTKDMGAKKKKTPQGRTRATPFRKPAAKSSGLKKTETDDLFGFLTGKLAVTGDIVSPIPDWSYWRPTKNLQKRG
jgi:hypothetical protein